MVDLNGQKIPTIKPFYTAEEVLEIRTNAKVSQREFALCLNTTIFTVNHWEKGTRKPNFAFCKLLNLVEKNGLEILL